MINHVGIRNEVQPFRLSLKSFLPGGKWTPCDNRGVFSDSKDPMWTKDSLTGAVYLNQPTGVLRFKLSFLTGLLAGVIGGNALSLGINAGYRALKVVSLSHFWLPSSCIDPNHKWNGRYDVKKRVVELAKDVARIVATPFAWLGLFFASWIGAFSFSKNGPRDGAKIFSSIEIAMYGGRMDDGYFGWAPCYQPEANSHAFGGNINHSRAF